MAESSPPGARPDAVPAAEPTGPSAPGADEETEPGVAAEMSRLFLVPALIVALCIGVFLLFGLIAAEGKSAHDYLQEVRQGTSNRRWQAAFELSRILATDPKARTDPRLGREIVEILGAAGASDPLIRRYLVLALEQVGDPGTAPALEALLGDGDFEVRLYATRALGSLTSPRSVEALLPLLEDPDAALRKMALWSLGRIGDASAAPRMRARLDDPAEDVRWNAALSLAVLGDSAGAETLQRMLDPAHLDRVEGITESQKLEARINAVQAAFRLRDPALRARVEEISRTDPSLKVRDVALRALQQWR